ncbi:uncharacterized protein LOC120343970 [Styela clava]
MLKALHPLCRNLTCSRVSQQTSNFSSFSQWTLLNKTYNGQLSEKNIFSMNNIGQVSKIHTLQFQKKCCNILNLNTQSVSAIYDLKNVAFISGRFLELEEVQTEPEQDRFNFDKHYEEVRQQNFGPVPVSECDFPSGDAALTTWEYAKRDHLVYDGIKYSELPIASIQAKYNNTFISIHSTDGKPYAFMTCGRVGFKNSKKKTIHAAESVGKRAAETSILRGCHKHVRVVIKGPGYGRVAAIRGLVQGGLNVVSISDITPLHVDGLPQRPRKIRRI